MKGGGSAGFGSCDRRCHALINIGYDWNTQVALTVTSFSRHLNWYVVR